MPSKKASAPELKGCYDFTLGYSCDAVCGFCSQELSWRRDPPLSKEGAFKAIFSAYQEGYRRIGLLGGEVTLRKDLLTLIAFARKCGFRSIRLLTNGIRMADRDYTEELVSGGLDWVGVSIHGHTAELHDRLVAVPGAFDKAVKTLGHLKDLKVHAAVKILVNSLNVSSLPEMMRFFRGNLGITDLSMTYPLYTGDMMSHLDEMKLSYAEAVPFVREAFTVYHGLKNGSERLPVLHNFPVCVLPGFREQITDLDPETTELGRPAEAESGRTDKDQVPACLECSERSCCPGLDPAYLRLYGESEIVPLKSGDNKGRAEHV